VWWLVERGGGDEKCRLNRHSAVYCIQHLHRPSQRGYVLCVDLERTGYVAKYVAPSSEFGEDVGTSDVARYSEDRRFSSVIILNLSAQTYMT
jgi:hypothetical protein